MARSALAPWAEEVSPSATPMSADDLVRLWLSVGARLVWVVWPPAQQVDVWFSGGSTPRALNPGDVLDGMDVLPGFTLSVASLFQ
jgi:hypothetical protein